VTFAPMALSGTTVFDGPANCSDTITEPEFIQTGTQSFIFTPTAPQGLDPLTLTGATTLPVLQQGVSFGPVAANWSVSQVNHAPDGANDESSTAAGVGVDIDALSNDTDPDGDTLDLVSVNDPIAGSALISRGAGPPVIRYIPDPGFVGTDTFGYQLRDNHGATAAAAVTVTVDGVSGTLELAQTQPPGANQSFSYTGPIPSTLTGTAITQTQVPGWTLSSITCSRGLVTASLPTATAVVTITADSTTTCTFSNAKLGDLTINVAYHYNAASALNQKRVTATGGSAVTIGGGAVTRVTEVCVFDEWLAALDKPAVDGIATLGPVVFGPPGATDAAPLGYDPFVLVAFRSNKVTRSEVPEPGSFSACQGGPFGGPTTLRIAAGTGMGTASATWWIQGPGGKPVLKTAESRLRVVVTTTSGTFVCTGPELSDVEKIPSSAKKTLDFAGQKSCAFTLSG
jgi:hypothetical protein